MTHKPNIALFYGGYNNESAVSFKSGNEVYNHLNKDKFNIFPIEITEDDWYYNLFSNRKSEVNRHDLSLTIDGIIHKMDFCFIALHGTPGEDGKIQGYLDILKIPYISVSAIESAVTFNKRYTVAISNYYGINTAKHIFILKGEIIDIEFFQNKLNLPVFVKPCKSGSSIGISIVSDWTDIENAINNSFIEDDELIIEEKVNGLVYTIGVFKYNDEIIVAPPLLCQLIDGTKDFFDYETKTTPNSYSALLTDTLTSEQGELIEKYARQVFRVFGNKGIMRIDTILNEVDGKPYLLEINTIPGMTANSAFPTMIKAMGWSISTFYENLILEQLDKRVNSDINY
jgi:D-alanine-D-alanine ligase